MMPQRAKVRRVWAERNGWRHGVADAQRVRAGGLQHGVENGGDVGRGDGSVGDAAGGGGDFDQRFEPEEAARAVAHELRGEAAPGEFGLHRARHLVGADGKGSDVGGHVEAQGLLGHGVHRCIAESARASSMPGRRRPAGSPSRRAAGAQAHRPRQ